MKKSAKQPGLWDRIRAKRERGEKPAKPGDKDFPDAKMWKKLTNKPKKQAAADTPCSCGCGDTVSTCKCAASCKCRQKGGSCYKTEKNAANSPAWQRSAGKNPEGGLNEKGRKSYERETGGDLKAPVTENNPKGDRAKRQNSFCSRMCGMKRVNTGSKAKKDPDSRINKSLRKWNCKCSNEMEFGVKLAEAPLALGQTYRPPVLNSNARKQLANYQGPRPPWTDEDTPFAQGLLQKHYPKRYPNAQSMSPQDTWTAMLNEAMVRPPRASMASRGGVNLRPAPVNAFMTDMNEQRPQWKNAIPAAPQIDTKTYQPYPPLDPQRSAPQNTPAGQQSSALQTVKTQSARDFGEKYAELMLPPINDSAPNKLPAAVLHHHKNFRAVGDSGEYAPSSLLPGLGDKPLTDADITNAKAKHPTDSILPPTAPAPAPAPTPTPSVGKAEQSNLPLLVAGGGLSAAGLLALYYMMQDRKKDKKRRKD